MATVVNFTASLKTRKATSASNNKNGIAAQEFYSSGYNYVGIICFSGMNLAGKVITGVQFTVKSNQSGYGASSTKQAYLCQANYQNSIVDGVTGAGYAGSLLGTLPGSYYNNTTTNTFTGTLLTNVANYLAAGNNTFVLYNPSPSASSQGYSYNYFQWSSVVITVAYEEASSAPTTSASSVNLGSAVTIYTNRASSVLTHTITYAFGNTTGTVATNVGASVSWTPPLTLSSQIPNATSGTCTITCQTYSGGTLTGTRTCTITLNVPSSIVPSITAVSFNDSNTTVQEKIGAYVRLLSRLVVAITAEGSYGSTISSYRTTLDGVTYTGASFIANAIKTAGELPVSVIVTDSRGRTATFPATVTILDYNYPSIRQFSAERCTTDGSETQVDGINVRYSFDGSISSLGNKNGVSAMVYYKLTSAEAWVQAESIPISAYTVTATNKLLSQTFDALASYDLKVRFSDYFYYVEQVVQIGTKQVILDILSDGSGIGIGKMAESTGECEIGWPLVLSEPLSVENGGTGATNATDACSMLGAVKRNGDTMIGNLNIQGYTTPSLKLRPTYGSSKIVNAVVEGNFNGFAALQACEDEDGNNRRQLEVRTQAFQPGLDYAALLRTNENGTWATYRLFHSGMSIPVPVTQGGTGANSAADARTNLGLTDASNLTSGTLPLDRLPFKIQYGSVYISGVSWTTVNLTGFTAAPVVVVSYGGNSSSSGIAPLKTANESASSFQVCMCGSSSSVTRIVHWIAIGV